MRTKTKMPKTTGYEFINKLSRAVSCPNMSDLIQQIQQQNGELFKTFVKEEKDVGNAEYYIAYIHDGELRKFWA